MAATIVSPADAATGTPNPLQVEGTATGADFVQVRLERSDGDVYDGANWVDDPTMYTPVANAGNSISATVDIRPFDRLWQTGNERFVVEVEALFSDRATGDIQYFVSGYESAGIRWFVVYVSASGTPALSTYETDGSQHTIGASSTLVQDGDLWTLRFTADRDNPTIEESINGGAWTTLSLSTDTMTTSTLDWGYDTGSGDTAAAPVIIGNLQPGGTTTELSDGSVLSAKMTAANGATIFDLDFTRDADAGHADADPIIAADGIVWTKTGGSVDRVRADHLFTAFGTTDWTWATPTLDPIAHTIAARTVSAGTPSAWTANTFTPSQIVATQGDLFVRRGTGRYLWVTQLADPNNPTYSEIAAATDITCDVSDFSGVSRNHELQPVPSLVSPNIRSHVGAVAHQTPSLAMYDRTSDSSAFRTLFTAGTTGYLILVPHGTTLAGDRVTVIPAVSGGNSDVWTVANEPARYVVTLGLTGRIRESFVTL